MPQSSAVDVQHAVAAALRHGRIELGAQLLHELVAEHRGDIVLPGADGKLGELRRAFTEDVVLKRLRAVTAAERNAEALFRVEKTGASLELHAAVDGKAAFRGEK